MIILMDFTYLCAGCWKLPPNMTLCGLLLYFGCDSCWERSLCLSPKISRWCSAQEMHGQVCNAKQHKPVIDGRIWNRFSCLVWGLYGAPFIRFIIFRSSLSPCSINKVYLLCVLDVIWTILQLNSDIDLASKKKCCLNGGRMMSINQPHFSFVCIVPID